MGFNGIYNDLMGLMIVSMGFWGVVDSPIDSMVDLSIVYPINISH